MKSILLALLAALALAQGANANLITNGDFESPAIPAGSPGFFVFTPSIPGWTETVIGGGIELQNGFYGTPHGGNQLAELDTYNNSGMVSAAFATTVGNLYDLSFYYSNRPGYPAASQGLSGSVGGVSFIVPGGNGAADTVWVKYDVQFIGTGSDTINFTALGLSDGAGTYLDDISVDEVAVPEHGKTFVFLGGALCCLGLVRRRMGAVA